MTRKLSRRSILAGSAAVASVIPTVGLCKEAGEWPKVVEVEVKVNDDDTCAALDEALKRVNERNRGHIGPIWNHVQCFVRITTHKLGA